MIKSHLLIVAVVAACLAALSFAVTAGGAQQEEEPRRAAPPAAFDKYIFVLLALGDEPPQDLSPEALRELQSQHLGHLTKMAEEGYALVAGPFNNRFDEKWRGMVLFRGDLTMDEVRELAEADPSVQAGLMKVEVMEWYTGAGALKFPMAEAMAKGPTTQPAD